MLSEESLQLHLWLPEAVQELWGGNAQLSV